jgi:uncharacterized damage-inducible protein DinB
MDTLRKLLAHLEWADQRALEALRRAEVPSPAAFELYAHVVGAEHVWLSRLRGALPALTPWPQLDLEQSARVAEENVRGFEEFMRNLGAADRHRTIEYRNSAGVAFQSTVEDILLQVALHGSYHRGQVAQLLRQSGAEPIATDYIAFIRGAPAATRS